MALCACGCGGVPARSSSRFLPGHNGTIEPRYEVVQSGCWVWQNAVSRGGYGVARAPGGGQMYAHRLFYENAFGPVPAGMQLDHLCRNRRCVNPEHLEAVTSGENTRRGLGLVLTGGESARGVARRLGLHHSTISKLRRREHALTRGTA